MRYIAEVETVLLIANTSPCSTVGVSLLSFPELYQYMVTFCGVNEHWFIITMQPSNGLFCYINKGTDNE